MLALASEKTLPLAYTRDILEENPLCQWSEAVDHDFTPEDLARCPGFMPLSVLKIRTETRSLVHKFMENQCREVTWHLICSCVAGEM